MHTAEGLFQPNCVNNPQDAEVSWCSSCLADNQLQLEKTIKKQKNYLVWHFKQLSFNLTIYCPSINGQKCLTTDSTLTTITIFVNFPPGKHKTEL